MEAAVPAPQSRPAGNVTAKLVPVEAFWIPPSLSPPEVVPSAPPSGNVTGGSAAPLACASINSAMAEAVLMVVQLSPSHVPGELAHPVYATTNS